MGNNENNGGNLGSGSAAGNFVLPVLNLYAIQQRNPIVNDGVSVSDGDNWGFLINKNNQYYSWRYNNKGQLGCNSITTQITQCLYNNILVISKPCPKRICLPIIMFVRTAFWLYADFSSLGKSVVYHSLMVFLVKVWTGPGLQLPEQAIL
jgi:alpha-tubulin suppressor-like RCC1 family protein